MMMNVVVRRCGVFGCDWYSVFFVCVVRSSVLYVCIIHTHTEHTHTHHAHTQRTHIHHTSHTHREVSRQEYLKKRELQKLDELRDSIEDEERMFAVCCVGCIAWVCLWGGLVLCCSSHPPTTTFPPSLNTFPRVTTIHHHTPGCEVEQKRARGLGNA